MEKVYFDKEFYGSWVVKNLSDMYAFNYIDIRTNEEKSAILVWKRSPVHEEGVGDNERLCAVEFEGEEFFFIEKYDPEYSKFFIYAKDPWELERLCKEKNIVFVGEKIS